MRGRFCPGILVVSALASAACSGDALCPNQVMVAFAPTQITVDLDAFAPGVQTNLLIETSLLVGDVVTLEVLDAGGTQLATLSRAVDADRRAEFDYVTVPTPRAVLRATGHGICGEDEDEIAVDVPADLSRATGRGPR